MVRVVKYSVVFPPRIDAYLRPEAFLGDLGVDENLMSDEFWHTLREALSCVRAQQVVPVFRAVCYHMGDSEIRGTLSGPYYKGILLFGDLYWGSPILD